VAAPAAAQTAVFQPTSGTATWNAAANWNPATVPNAVGASATFNNAASGSNPAQTGNRTITADAALTVGTITFNNDGANAFTNSVTTGTGGTLTFDEVGAGPATITVPAAVGTGNNTISVPVTLADTLVATVNDVTATSAAGALNLTATITGPGGFVKQGDGLATFGTGAKTYTGPTALNGGRMRMSVAAQASMTSSFTINSGGQLTPITATAPFTFGGTVLNLNGAGPTSGPFAQFPGAIRADTNLAFTISTPSVVLQSPTLLHVEGAATGSITIQGAVSGPGSLALTAPGSSVNQGQLVLTGTNSYSGGTLVRGGNLIAGATSVNAFGTGNVTVDQAGTDSIARLEIQTGAANAVNDFATLALAGGFATGGAPSGFAILNAGVNEVVGGLVLGGVAQTIAGTYGSTASLATFRDDRYFSGTGVVTLVPEPAHLLLAAAAVGLAVRRGRRRPA
jgi:autotransporter-associated beta strand protein